jgi:hypothetical protein
MKVFNYSNGTKGELLGNIRRAHGNSGNVLGEDETAIVVYSVNGFQLEATPYREWYDDDGAHFDPLNLPEKFKVAAVCYCLGKFNNGNGYDEWVWACTGTEKWILEQVAAGKADFKVWAEVNR